MAEDVDANAASSEQNGSSSKRRRRRRRRRRSDRSAAIPDDVLVAENPTPEKTAAPQRRGRRTVEVAQTAVSLPSSGRNPYRKRSSRPRRTAPASAAGRRRRLSRGEVEELTEWIGQMPEPVMASLYRGLGGQPERVTNRARLVQLTVRALAQGSRLATLLKNLHERDRKALAALVQSGGIAHAEELHRELQLSFGGHEREWAKVMVNLGSRGLVFASAENDGQFFYLIPDPVVDSLLLELEQELVLPTFAHDDVRVMDAKPFCPPLHFSITTLATYIDQHAPRFTQRQEIHRHDKEEMDAFFAQLWEPDSELFSFHLQFLMMHSMVELRAGDLKLNRDVLEEWLQLDAEDQRDLLFRALAERFPLAEWVLWAVFKATNESLAEVRDGEAGGEWVAERPLVAQYRRWKRGEDWRSRFQRGQYANVRGHERESYSFAPLVHAGILEMGQWGQEKFYRLSPRGRQLLEPGKDDAFEQFYLTPSFEIMAMAGLTPILLFRIAELARLTKCDRVNEYKITEESIQRALEGGWRRDDVLQFLRDNSQIGLPDNVEQTLKGWIGHRGDVEFHEATLLTVHRSQIRRLESQKRIKPFILHRFAPGLYAVDKSRLAEIRAVLEECRFSPSKEIRQYPGDPSQVEARNALHKLVNEARAAAVQPAQRGQALVSPPDLRTVPGSRVAKGPESMKGETTVPDLPPEVTVEEVRQLIDVAMTDEIELEMIYVAKNGQRIPMKVRPERLALKADAPVLVGLDVGEDERRTFVLDRIERLRLADATELEDA